MKLAVVVQRYGADIGGGAELHARYLAERLSRHVEVRVLTTCARDYVSWRNHWPAGEDRVNGVTVERFPVAQERDIVGAWPGTLREARRQVLAGIKVKLEAEQLDHLARIANLAARRGWESISEPDLES